MTRVASKPISLPALVSGIGLFVAVITAITIPAGFLYVEYSSVGSNLAFKASLKANRLAKYIYSHDALWQYQTGRLAELIEVPEATASGDQQRIFDAAGALVMEIGKTPAFPTLTRPAPILVAGTTVGRIEVTASVRSVAIQSSVVAALSCLLGFGMFFAVRVFPLRVLDRTLRALENTKHELQGQNSRFDAALNNMSQGLVLIDADERVVVCNDQYIRMYDLSRDVVKFGCSLSELVKHRAERGYLLRDANQYSAEISSLLGQGKRSTVVVATADGREISIAYQPMTNGGWVVTHEDITEQRKWEAKISHMALHDALTSLPNRVFFREQLQSQLARLSGDHKLAVLCLDLDRFKRVNDTLGHPFGDSLLKQAAKRMIDCLRDGDTIARLGGDEFAILQCSVRERGDAITLANRLLEVTAAPFDLDGQQVVVGTSIGIAIAPDDATDPDQLLKNADMALYLAKAEGRGTHRFFETGMDTRMQARHGLELDLRTALADGQFELYYQPLVNLKKQEILGFEALIRWNHPRRGLVLPLDFIAVAEDTALIVPIGEWVLRQACSEAMKWPSNISIAVNISPAQFKSSDLPWVVTSALTQSGLAPQRLELEITESVLLVDNEATLRTLHHLRRMGVRISMDDFGVGYSSLSYLRSFPFDKIKIDRSFVHDLTSNKDSQAIVRAVTALGNSLGMATTGEGVETQEELEYLEKQGCTEAQGYYFSKPKPAREVLELLSKHRIHNRAVA